MRKNHKPARIERKFGNGTSSITTYKLDNLGRVIVETETHYRDMDALRSHIKEKNKARIASSSSSSTSTTTTTTTTTTTSTTTTTPRTETRFLDCDTKMESDDIKNKNFPSNKKLWC